METWGPVIAVNVLARTVSLCLMIFLLHYLIRMAGLNGPIVKRMRDVWIATVLLGGWVWLVWLESAIDFLPGIHLRTMADPFSFIPHGVLCVTLIRLWLSINPIMIEQRLEKGRTLEHGD
jgi:hypothetical protein